MEGEKLERIDCKVTNYPSGKFLEEYLGYAFDIPEYLLPGASTLSVTRDGETRAAFLDETRPENLLFIGGLVEEAASRPSSHVITYDSDEFLMGGIHFDYDLREIWLWRTWDNNIDIELPEYWRGWTLHDCGYRYREFYENAPSFIVFVPQSELSYVDRIGKSVCRRAGYGAAQESVRRSLERSFEAVRKQYLEENPGPILLPSAKNGALIGGGNWNFDSQGNIKIGYSMGDHFTSIDGLDSAYGISLSALEGEEIKAIYALHDGEEWDYDAPIVMRLGSTDVAVDSVSCCKLAIGIERVRTDRTARMLGCDIDPDRSFDDLVGDLKWRIHECTDSVRGARIEQFYWTTDDRYCPLALCCRLDNGLHLRIGDFGDETRPSVGDPRDEAFFDEFEPYALPMQYPKPAANLPKIELYLKIQNREMLAVDLDRPYDDGLVMPRNWFGRTFVGGFEVVADIPFVNSLEPNRTMLGIGGLPKGTTGDFLIGKIAVFLSGRSKPPTSENHPQDA